MDRLKTRASGFVATAAVHVGIAALLLAGWQVTRPKPPPKPIIAAWPMETSPAPPTSRDSATAAIARIIARAISVSR